ncbi:hypothetical protein DTQ70_30445 (plasmid) [Runella sp. SP2]|nr:hypothetical protein DTQ70_30445 [Runella sp. SP2]
MSPNKKINNAETLHFWLRTLSHHFTKTPSTPSQHQRSRSEKTLRPPTRHFSLFRSLKLFQ